MQEQTLAGAKHGNHRKGRARKVLLATLAMTVIGGAAFAYWTTTGTGTGAADTADSVQAVTVHQTSTVSGLAPGSGTQALSGNFTNPNDGPVYITAVSAEITAVNDTTGAALAGCTAADYTIAGTGAVGAEVPSGANVGSWGNLTIAFANDTTRNQDACKNAQLVISYTAS